LLIVIPGYIHDDTIARSIIRTVIGALIVNLYLNLAFYPSLLKYQSGSEAAFIINKQNKSNRPVAQLNVGYDFPLAFYSDMPLITIDFSKSRALPPKPFYLYSYVSTIKELKAAGWQMQEVATLPNYWISRLKPAFLNHNTRHSAIDTVKVVIVR
jgi:hypothetical protein